MTPNQLWHLGQALNPVSDPGANGIPTPEIEWEENGYMTEPHPGINVPVLDSPLTDHEILELQDNINPLKHSDSFGSGHISSHCPVC
uniref:Uncharacterized protein n=2 Tax=Nothobranchius furzeri TaxID=105023 RepID=A0A1A8U1B4_NOTFU